MGGNTRKTLCLILEFCCYVHIFVTVQAIIDEEPSYCEVYYATVNNTVTITCIHGDEFDPSVATDVIRNGCDGYSNIDQWFYYTATKLELFGCILTPGMFRFLMPLPYMESFDSKHNLGYMTSEQSSYGTILFSGIFEGLCSLEAIDLSYSDLGIVEPDAFRCLDSVRYLNLSSNGIDFLPPDSFSGMPELTHLNLGDNQLGELSPGLFENLTFLLVLDLQYNNISSLPEGIFRCQSSLQRLVLTGNRLTVLDEDIFENMTELRKLELASNRLKYLENVFSVNNQLWYLDLSWNKGLSLGNGTLIGLTSLKVLSLEGCGMDPLPKEIFLDAGNLTYLYADGNRLSKIDSKLFASLHNLKELVLSNNLIDTLGGDSFGNLSKLKVLVLSDNRIVDIGSNAFRELPNLVTLDLSKNGIRYIDGKCLYPLTGLERLDLSDNSLSSLHDRLTFKSILDGLIYLEQLNVANNSLGRIRNAFFLNGELRTLVISRNAQLQLDSRSFAGLYQLKYLFMESCNIRSLPSGIFRHLLNLKTLHVRNNFIKEIYFADLYNLRNLYLDFNNITSLSNRPFRLNRALRQLRMSNNNISVIDSFAFEGLLSVHFLDVSHNRIERITHRSLNPLRKIMTLDISHNFISVIEGLDPLGYNAALSILDASHNRLSTISNIHWWKMTNLYEFWVADNGITELYLPQDTGFHKQIHLERNNVSRIRIVSDVRRGGPPDASPNLQPKSKIYLSGNPLQCGCELDAYVTKHETDLEFVDGPQCRLREHLSRPTGFNETDFMCNSCPRNCTCENFFYDNAAAVTVVNCSNGDYADLPSVAPPNTNVLFIDHNNLTSLAALNRTLWKNLIELHAGYNSIGDEDFFLPDSLKLLDLRGNRLSILPAVVQKHAQAVEDFRVSLSNNPWPCDCTALSLKYFLFSRWHQIPDVSDVRCTFSSNLTNFSLLEVRTYDLCPEYYSSPSNIHPNAVTVHPYVTEEYSSPSSIYPTLTTFQVSQREIQNPLFLAFSCVTTAVVLSSIAWLICWWRRKTNVVTPTSSVYDLVCLKTP